ncbi:MAG: IclR family transcriptional regulator [Jannaschia sp.]
MKDDEPISDGDADLPQDRNFVTALARGLDVLRCFRPNEPTLSNNDIAQRTGLPKPTVTRLTHTLCRLGYLVHSDSTGFYRLGAGVLELGYGVLAGIDISDRAVDTMQALQSGGPNPNVSVALGERHRFKMVYIAVERSRESVSLSMSVGARLPLFHSAMGRAALCAMTDTARVALLDAAAQEGREAMEIVHAGLDRALEEYATHGYCTSFGQWRETISGIAVPLRSLSGDRLYAMNVGAPAFLVSPEELSEIYGPRLVAAAKSLSDVPRRT